MINLQTAENALKSVYIGAVTDLLNTKASPLLARFEQTSEYVTGKEVVKAMRTGIDGGVAAGDEDGTLPVARDPMYMQIRVPLKNIFGQIEISDKAIRAGSDSRGAFTNLLNQSLEGLLEASRFNLSRMIMGDGTGFICRADRCESRSFIIQKNHINSSAAFVPGMVISAASPLSTTMHKTNLRVVNVTTTSTGDTQVWVDQNLYAEQTSEYYVNDGRGKEITGIAALYDKSYDAALYGYLLRDYSFLKAADPCWDNLEQEFVPQLISDELIQLGIDSAETNTSCTTNYITCSRRVRLAYQAYLSEYKRNVDIMELAGGFKTISYNGIPIVSDKFNKNRQMLFLDTDAFKLHQLCDWQFLENENGKVLHQIPSKAAYSATLVKYCELICDKPNGQSRIIVDC